MNKKNKGSAGPELQIHPMYCGPEYVQVIAQLKKKFAAIRRTGGLREEKELEIFIDQNYWNTERKIQLALERLEKGHYHTCLHCEEEISIRRLIAVPETPFCIACQSSYDSGGLPELHRTIGEPPRTGFSERLIGNGEVLFA